MTRSLTAEETKKVLADAAAHFRSQSNGAGALVCRRVFEATTLRIDDACVGRCFNVHPVASVDELRGRLHYVRVVVPNEVAR